METMTDLFSIKKIYRLIMTASFLLVCCVPANLLLAEEGAERGIGPTMEFNITIQANVLRLCAGGRLYDLI